MDGNDINLDDNFLKWNRSEQIAFLECCFKNISCRAYFEECLDNFCRIKGSRDFASQSDIFQWILTGHHNHHKQSNQADLAATASPINSVDSVREMFPELGPDVLDPLFQFVREGKCSVAEVIEKLLSMGESSDDAASEWGEEDPLESLRYIFPNEPASRLVECLQLHDGDFESALMSLMAGPEFGENDEKSAVDILCAIFPERGREELETLWLESESDLEAVIDHLEMEDMLADESIAQLQDIFPTQSVRELRRVLDQCESDLSQAIEKLLISPAKSIPTPRLDPKTQQLVDLFPDQPVSYLKSVQEFFDTPEEVIEWILVKPGEWPPARGKRRRWQKYVSKDTSPTSSALSNCISFVPARHSESNSSAASTVQEGRSYASALSNQAKNASNREIALPVNLHIARGELRRHGNSEPNTASFWGNKEAPVTDGNYYRNCASEAFENCRNHFQRAMQAYRSRGRYGPSIAAYYAQQGRKHHLEMQENNRKASDLIFRNMNPNFPTSISNIDLHGLHVKEAVRYVDQVLVLWRRNPSLSQVVFVTGIGLHSTNGFSPMRKAVIRHLMAHGYEIVCPNGTVICKRK